MKGNLSSRAKAISLSATLEIDELGKKLRAAGKPVISFGAGEPDFPTPEAALEAAKAGVDSPKMHKYSPVGGLLKLREKVAKQINAEQALPDNATFSAEDIIVTNGGKQAVFESLAVLIDPDDEVLLPKPSWLTYAEVVKYLGGKSIAVETDREYKITPETLSSAYTDKTSLLVLNSPANPTGAVYTEDELIAIGKWCLERDIWCVADEIYEYLIYPPLLNERVEKGFQTAPHLLEVCPELRERTIIINGVAKSSAMTGWRVGWAAGPRDAINAMKRMQGHLTSNVNNIAQVAAISALESINENVSAMRSVFDERRLLISSLLNEIDLATNGYFRLASPQGAFYAFVDISGLIGKEIGKSRNVAMDANDFAKMLLEEVNVAVVPMDSFGIENHIRFSYALASDDIREGIRRIHDFLTTSN
ncbi:MAG: pyridoxal phosphate-dependent aminotransferase [Candidatus Ancillula sp.]|jgi:aspartate/methionine/tyrosine aminotransferase|nr:pyridoxal phosphate-dependent aminotransferase [Candidatus Ancillula sp.]